MGRAQVNGLGMFSREFPDKTGELMTLHKSLFQVSET